MASPMRLDPALVAAAEKEGTLQKRSAPKQIEYWAELGRAMGRVINLADVFAVLQGLKKVKLEPVTSVSVSSDDVFKDIEKRREAGELSKTVTSSAVYFEASPNYPGLLDRVDTAIGERQTGYFRNGKFKVQT